ncbi:pectinesterase A [Tothia fuscella]|uniref:pectinesterase n=1 Tax=Tothia fuscella TaxID=1048955 RepID=A0A9P4P2K0_9PEZI|nr:pectinesterase A [Tothia fuscella]
MWCFLLFTLASCLFNEGLCSSPTHHHNHKRQSKSRTTPPPNCIPIGKDTKNPTIKSALASLGTGNTPACLFLNPGTYQEQIVINYKGPLTVYGSTPNSAAYSANTVTITHSVNSATAGNLDKSSTVLVMSSNVKFYNVNFKNGFGPEKSQAVAFTAHEDSRHLSFYACQFLSHQDTLYVKSGSTTYFNACYIEGNTDFIFGGGSAWLQSSTIASNAPGYITASGRDKDDPSWFVFDKCKIIATPNSKLSGKVFLGRPWRKLARVMFQNSMLSDILHKEGWTKMADGATPLFYEWNNTGAGAKIEGRRMESKATGAVKIESVLRDWEGWVDRKF